MGWSKPGAPTTLNVGGQVVTKSKELAKVMNEAFIGKVNRIKNSIPATHTDPLEKTRQFLADKLIPTFTFRHVTMMEMSKIISTLSNSTAAGIDDMGLSSVLKR